MLTSLIVSQILSWIVIIGLVVALLALARQVGVRLNRYCGTAFCCACTARRTWRNRR